MDTSSHKILSPILQLKEQLQLQYELSKLKVQYHTEDKIFRTQHNLKRIKLEQLGLDDSEIRKTLRIDKIIFNHKKYKSYYDSLSKGIAGSINEGLKGSSLKTVLTNFTNSITSSVTNTAINQFSKNLFDPSKSLFQGIPGGGYGFAGALTAGYVLNNYGSVKSTLFGKTKIKDSGFILTKKLEGYFDNEIGNIKKYEQFKRTSGLFGKSKTWTEITDFTINEIKGIRKYVAELNKLNDYFSLGGVKLDKGKYSGNLTDELLDEYLSQMFGGIKQKLVQKVKELEYGKILYENQVQYENVDYYTEDTIPSNVLKFRTRVFEDDFGDLTEDSIPTYKIVDNPEYVKLKKSWEDYAKDLGKELTDVVIEAGSKLKENDFNLDVAILELSGNNTLDKQINKKKEDLNYLTKLYSVEIGSNKIDENTTLNNWSSIKQQILKTNEYTPMTVEAINNLNTALIELKKNEYQRLQALKEQRETTYSLFDKASNTKLFEYVKIKKALERQEIKNRADYLKKLIDLSQSDKLINKQDKEDLQTIGNYFSEGVKKLDESIKELSLSFKKLTDELLTSDYSPLKDSEKAKESKKQLDNLYKELDNILADGIISKSEEDRFKSLQSDINSSVKNYLSNLKDSVSDDDYLKSFNEQTTKLSTYQNISITTDTSAIDNASNNIVKSIESLKEEIKNIKIQLDVKTDLEATVIALKDKGLV